MHYIIEKANIDFTDEEKEKIIEFTIDKIIRPLHDKYINQL